MERREALAVLTGHSHAVHSVAERTTATAIHAALVEAGHRITADQALAVSDIGVHLAVAPSGTPA